MASDPSQQYQKARNALYLILGIMGVTFLLILILGILGLLGISPLGTGCFMRYPTDGAQSLRSIVLMASGNYTTQVNNATGAISIDPSTYGKWKKTEWLVQQNEVVKLNVSGDISLCKAYLPAYNLNSTLVNGSESSANQTTMHNIPIPRIESTEAPLELKFDA
ncbi:MAG: hypothetical protein V4485_04480, partial [Pseudomonadota bacterium]